MYIFVVVSINITSFSIHSTPQLLVVLYLELGPCELFRIYISVCISVVYVSLGSHVGETYGCSLSDIL